MPGTHGSVTGYSKNHCNVRIIGQRSHLRLWKIAVYNPIKKPAKIICESHPELCNAASQDFQAVLVKIGQRTVNRSIHRNSQGRPSKSGTFGILTIGQCIHRL
jgi:hypothetical protein